MILKDLLNIFIIILIPNHFDEDKSFDLLSRRGDPCPPLLRKIPLNAKIYLS